MKALVLEEFGSAPVLRSVQRPLPAPGEVVVRSGVVDRAGVQPGQLVLDQGSYDLTTAAQGHHAVASGTAHGKVTIRVSE
jgi:D-arabinose 1-dehydrogenase-like Zn-dependent alcohol dehydrogenase